MDDIERLRRWIEDPPELATPQDVLSMLASLTSLTDELQRLRGERDDAEAVWTAYGKAQRERAEKAEAENTELRAALERIAGTEDGVERVGGYAVDIARQALASHTGDTDSGT